MTMFLLPQLDILLDTPEELPAIVSSLIFVVHPVHVDVRTPLGISVVESRAYGQVGMRTVVFHHQAFVTGVLCGFFSVAALILVGRRRGTLHRGMTDSSRRGHRGAIFVSQEVDGNKGASGRDCVAGKGPSTEPADGAKKYHVVKEAPGDPGYAEGKTEATIPPPHHPNPEDSCVSRCSATEVADRETLNRSSRTFGLRPPSLSSTVPQMKATAKVH